MHGQADGLGLVGERALDGLLDPPRAVSGEFGALGRVKPFDGLHQADVALADQIQQRQADALVIAGDFHDEPQVGLDHLFARLFVALFDARGQVNFLLRRQQFHLADFAQVKLDGGVAVVMFGSRWMNVGVALGGFGFAAWRGRGRRTLARAAGIWFSAPLNFGRFGFSCFHRHKRVKLNREKVRDRKEFT